MRRRRPSATGASLAAALAALLLGGCASSYFHDAGRAPATAPLALADWPHREVWTGLVFNGEKVGFTHRVLRPAPDAPGLWEIESEAALRLRFLGIDKRLALRALDRVRADLTLAEFRYRNEIDGSALEVAGRVEGASLEYTVKAAGSEERRRVVLAGPLYPSSALGLLPAARGLALGARHRHQVFHSETQKLAEAEQEVLGWETSPLFAGPAFRTATRLLGMETTTWIAADGRPLFELGMHGVMISALEEEAAAKRYLLEAGLGRRDALVGFSLLAAGPLEAPRRISRLALEIDALPAGFAVPSEGGQSCAREGARLSCTIDRAAPLAQGDPRRYLGPTLAAPSNLPEVIDLAKRIAGEAPTAEKIIEKLLLWIDANIAREAIDSFSALDVLRERRAECQGHAYLLAALARALGIPARVVNGLAYSEAHGGFLYHAWNELWLEGRGWRPVDATFGQAHADATHLKLLEGEALADLVPLAPLIGRLRVASVAPLAHW